MRGINKNMPGNSDVGQLHVSVISCKLLSPVRADTDPSFRKSDKHHCPLSARTCNAIRTLLFQTKRDCSRQSSSHRFAKAASTAQASINRGERGRFEDAH